MSDGRDGFLVGMCFGIIIGLIVFLTRQDFLQQSCEKDLIKENRTRNFVCVVRMKSIVIDKLEQEQIKK